jgi:hypothetical protein
VEWRDAIIDVLTRAQGPVHYVDIAQSIAEQGLRNRDELGATPANTVNSVIGTSLKSELDHSPFIRVSKGIYRLRGVQEQPAATIAEEIREEEQSPESGVINAFGMFWERSKVLWGPAPHLYGQQQSESKLVDFGGQIGVYLLHDAQGVVYVGRVTDQTLGKRLYQHTVDRLSGRWNRFSWFGIYPVQSDGCLKSSADYLQVGIDAIITTMEAVLIEGLEPRQNRRRGDEFKAVEFLQSEDPQLERNRKLTLIQEIATELKAGRTV